MWNNSYRTPTERWQKTSDFPKRKKLPMYLGSAKEKRKNRDKRTGWDLHLRRRSFHTLGSPFTGGDGVGGAVAGGSFGATEDSTATGVQRAKQRDSHTEDRRQPALTSLRGLSAHPPGQVVAGS